MSNPTNERKYYYKQNFAFSTNYLDYEIPDFRGKVARAVPLLVLPNGAILDANLRPLQADAIHGLIQSTLADDNVFVCNDAVLLHQVALKQAGDSEEHRVAIWSLTDRHALWDACLLEQRIVWGAEGRVIDRPSFESLLSQYQVPKETLPPEGLRQVLIAQFEYLIDNLPFLMNDLVGRRIFREDEYDSPHIPAPTRVLARDGIHFKERLHVFVPLIAGWMRYGPACIGIDVQGGIAKHYLDQQNRQMPPGSRKRFVTELGRLRDTLQKSSDRRNYVALKNGKAEDDGSPAYTKSARASTLRHWNGAFGARRRVHRNLSEIFRNVLDSWNKSPDALRKALRRWNVFRNCDAKRPAPSTPNAMNTNDHGIQEPREHLKIATDKDAKLSPKRPVLQPKRLRTKCVHAFGGDYSMSQRKRRFPLDKTGALSLDPDHWGESILPCGPFRTWADYHVALKVVRLGNRFSHAAFPYLKSDVAEYADRKDIPLLTAPESSGRVLLEFRIRDIDLLSYLRTHLETDFIHDTGGEELAFFRRLAGCSEKTSTRTQWSRNAPAESLARLELKDGEWIGERLLSRAQTRDFWEAPSCFATYRFFERSQEDRDMFLCAIVDYNHDAPHRRMPWELLVGSWWESVQPAVKGLLRGFSDEMIAGQMQSARGDVTPENFQRPSLIGQIQEKFLKFGRFKVAHGSSLLNTVLPRLCVDPVYGKSSAETEEDCIRLDGEWRMDDRIGWPSTDPMARDAVADVTDYNQLAGRGENHYRFIVFLLPLIEERCRMLGIDEVEPSQSLLDRLMLTNAMSRNGKPGRPVYEFETPFTSWMETLDDLKKSIAYSIVRHCINAGCDLVAVSEESFIVDAERGSAKNIRARITTVIQNTAEYVLDLKTGEFGNFVDVTELSVWPIAEKDQDVQP